jgi:DNA polymerase-3 subunit delta
MIIFLYGRDGYRLKQNLDKIIEEYRRKSSGLNFDFLDLQESDQFEKLEDLIKTVSFFDEKRLAVIRGAFDCGEKIMTLIKNWSLANDKERILVFIEDTDEPELKKKDKDFFALLVAETSIVKTFNPLEGTQLKNWIIKEIKQAGLEIDNFALEKLMAYVGNDTWRLGQEINKLINYEANGPEITVKDVELLVRPNEDINIFEIIDAIANKNTSKAVRLLYNYLDADGDPYYIFSMILFQLRNLLRVKSLTKNAVPYPDILKRTGLKPFVLKKTYEQCRKSDLDELQHLFIRLAELDIEAKSGKFDLTDGLYQFVFSLQK